MFCVSVFVMLQNERPKETKLLLLP